MIDSGDSEWPSTGYNWSMSRYRWTLGGASWFLFFAASHAQTSGPPDPLFQSDEILEVRIVAPFNTILSSRSEERDTDGSLSYTDEAGTDSEFDVGIRARGLFRRDKKICPFPPLRLNFKGAQTKNTLFRKQNKVKLVTHCKDRSNRHEQSLLSEYIAYRILNELTDVSFRVRLLRITYVDTDKRDKDRVAYGFVIEHKDRLAKRLGVTAVEIEKTSVSALRPDYLNLISVFHYLLGNTDFSPIAGAKASCCHNHVLIGKEGEPLFSVPYDFDQAGLINAPYGITNPRFGLRSARQRLYRGRCSNNRYLDETIALFRSKRDTILNLATEQQGVDERYGKVMQSFLEKFFDTIDSPKQVQRKLVKKCV